MIRTAGGEALTRFTNMAFLDLMSHFCDTASFAPCDEPKCEIVDDEWKAIPFVLLDNAIGGDMQAFDEVGSEFFVRKKIAHLIKIARSEKEIQLDLVSELLLYLIGMNAARLTWEDDEGNTHWGDEPIFYPDRDELIDPIIEELKGEGDEVSPEYIEEISAKFNSLHSLMFDDVVFDDVFFDDDFTFLLEEDVSSGIRALYLAHSDYDRAWHERPWTDIGEEVPMIVKYDLDDIESEAAEFGGLDEMRDTYIRENAKKMSKM